MYLIFIFPASYFAELKTLAQLELAGSMAILLID